MKAKLLVVKRGRKPKPPPSRPHVYFYEWDNFAGQYRWWDNRNFGDQFNFVTKEELPHMLSAAAKLGIRTVDHLPGFCDLGDECPDHKGYH